MEIKVIESGKEAFLDLLLLADEDAKIIAKYLDRGDLFALYDTDLKSVCVVTDEGSGCYELQNLATYEASQGQGYGKQLVAYAVAYYQGEGRSMIVGTGDVPWILAFYEGCGFAFSHRLENYFVEHYPEPMFEEGLQLKDKIYLKMSLAQG